MKKKIITGTKSNHQIKRRFGVKKTKEKKNQSRIACRGFSMREKRNIRRVVPEVLLTRSNRETRQTGATKTRQM